MNKIIPTALLASLLLITLTWIGYPLVEEQILKFYSGFLKTSQIIQTSFRIKTALSIGIIPIISLVVSFINLKHKNQPVTNKIFLMNTFIVFIGYTIGFIIKFFFLQIGFRMADAYTLAPEIVNTIPLNQVVFFNYGLVGSITAGLTLILSKKQAI
jgi:hypothetical protein